MRQSRINLSSRPFTNRRLFWLGILCVMALCAASGIWISRARARALVRISEVKAQMASRQAEVDRVKREDEERRKQEAKIFLTDQDSYHLAAARQLIVRKSF